MAMIVPQLWSESSDCTLDESNSGAEIQLADHLTIAQAEDLLDWLESHGMRAHDVQIDTDGLMSVRWRS